MIASRFAAYGARRYGPERLHSARCWRRMGLSYAAIGARLGVSRQRVHQLLNPSPTKGRVNDHH
jgi:hypothetical protein